MRGWRGAAAARGDVESVGAHWRAAAGDLRPGALQDQKAPVDCQQQHRQQPQPRQDTLADLPAQRDARLAELEGDAQQDADVGGPDRREHEGREPQVVAGAAP